MADYIRVSYSSHGDDTGCAKTEEGTDTYRKVHEQQQQHLDTANIWSDKERCSSKTKQRSSATAEIAHDTDEMAIQGHSRSSVDVPVDAAYTTSY